MTTTLTPSTAVLLRVLFKATSPVLENPVSVMKHCTSNQSSSRLPSKDATGSKSLSLCPDLL
jgi:hypothetical protein